jgi:surfeit locus 1 family protein
MMMTMRIGPFSFAPRPVTTLAAAAFFALVASLGTWQMNRAEEKRERQALFDRRLAEPPLLVTGSVPSPEPLMYRRVRAAGRWLAERQIYVDNQIRDGRAGFHVVAPLQLEGGNAVVLVNRGWIARDRSYPAAPPVAAEPGRVEVTGLATRPPARYRELSGETITGSVWQNLSIERYAAHAGLDVLPVVILADEPARGLARVTEKPDAGVAKHVEYSLTWYALAATTLALWLAMNLKRVA